MSDEIKVVPPYDSSDPSKVLNPNGYPYILGTRDNVGNVPSYDVLRIGVSTGEALVPPVMDSDWPALVSGAGKTTTNGLYAYIDANNWKYSAYYIKRGIPYPTPESNSLAIVQGSSVYYYADDVPLPWDATWNVGSLGTAPVPTVTKQQPTRSAEKESKSEEPKEEPKKKKKFFDF